jgi:hypothetical protein
MSDTKDQWPPQRDTFWPQADESPFHGGGSTQGGNIPPIKPADQEDE